VGDGNQSPLFESYLAPIFCYDILDGVQEIFSENSQTGLSYHYAEATVSPSLFWFSTQHVLSLFKQIPLFMRQGGVYFTKNLKEGAKRI
jgi:hypothetical protein